MVILNSLRRSLARAFLNSVQNRTSRLYFFFGQINPPIDSPPESDSIDYVNYNRNGIFAIKELLPSDVCFVVPRIEYIPNVEYKPYDSLNGEGDYVLNVSNHSIYICVNKGNSISTETPSQLTVEPVTLSDGYTWRYVYTIPLALRDKFLTPQWMPVSNGLSESFFSNGGIDSVSILDAGEGYSANTTSIVVTGANGTGHGAILSPVVQDGKIVSVTIHESGYGYKSPKIMVLSPTSTREARITTTLSKGDIRSSQALIQTLAVPGTLESVDVINEGLGYTSNVQLTLMGDGQGGSIVFERNNSTGAITKVDIVNKGENYSWAKIVITDDNLIGGSGAELHVNVSRVNGFGRDVLSDLNASSVMVYQNFSREKLNGLPLENSIYRFGLIDNPKTTDGGVYPKDYVTRGNYITTIPKSQIAQYSIGTMIYNEYPITANTKSFIVEEQIIGVNSAGIRLRALDGGRISSEVRYFKDLTTSFVASSSSYSLSVDRQMVSACYVLEAPLIDTNIFTVGSILTKDSFRYVIVANSSDKLLVSSIDGGMLNTTDTLTDGSSNTITPTNIIPPLLDKKSGSLLTIEDSIQAITYGPQQTVSFRTVINFQ